MERLIIYRELNKDPIISSYNHMLHNSGDERLTNYYDIIGQLLILGKSLKGYIFHKMILTEHPILLSIASGNKISAFDKKCIRHDLSIVSSLLNGDIGEIISDIADKQELFYEIYGELEDPIEIAYNHFFDSLAEILYIDYNNGHSSDDRLTNYNVTEFIELIVKYGVGIYALHQVFYLKDTLELKPISTFEPRPFEMIYGYELEKTKLDNNTEAFIRGLSCHNALLVGASGTGKSSSVKAILKKYENTKLRLIQLTKSQLKYLPMVMKLIGQTEFKFIIFIDDLSFEVNEDDYKFLKSFIEGGITNEATNVVFYITSNRRHLIKEIRSERENDIHLNDFIQEMSSLSDRFGLTLFYQPPDQKLYYRMVEMMFKEAGMTYNQELVLLEAKQWSLRHGGMSGRVAEQFVKHYKMNMQLDLNEHK